MKKRRFLFVLTFLVLLGSLNLTFAQNENIDMNTKRVNYRNVLYTHRVPDSNFVSDPSVNINKMFNINQGLSKNQVSNIILGSRINFDYVIDEINEYTSYLSMEGSIFITNNVYDFKVDGEVDIITIGDKSLINGPITGFMTIDDVEVDLIVHFQKYKCSDDVLITMSLFDPEQNINAYLSFGENIMTDEFKNKIISSLIELENGDIVNNVDETKNTFIASSSPQYELVDAHTWLPTGIKSAQLYKNIPPTANRFKLIVLSDSAKIRNQLGATFAGVNAVTGRITSTQDRFDLQGTIPGAGRNVVLEDWLEFLFDAAGFPSQFLEAILSPFTNGKGDVSINGHTADKSMTISRRSLQIFNIDNNEFPMIFTFTKASGSIAALGQTQIQIRYLYYDIHDMHYYHTAQTSLRGFSTILQ